MFNYNKITMIFIFSKYKTLLRLLSLPHEHVLKQSYNCLKELKELGKCNWYTFVHEITIETGFEGASESQILDKKHLV